MIKDKAKVKIVEIWDNYRKNNFDLSGNAIDPIDANRIKAIKEIKYIISNFLTNRTNVYEFKTSLDSYNKRNNLWGFTATKGQMFFNQLTKNNETSIDKLSTLLKETISEPKDLKDALSKIETLEKFCSNIYIKAKDKRKVPNPGSVGYFLSYFWQIHNFLKWPIIYTSLTNAFKEINVWLEHSSQKENYEYFYNLNEKIKEILKAHAKKEISNWDAEHSFWDFAGKPVIGYKKAKKEPATVAANPKSIVSANFEITDYLIPKVAKLIELGGESDKSASSKGSEYEKMVSLAFQQLGFEVDTLGQGTGRNPDAIIKFREEHTAFIVDAKAYNDGYIMGRDDRAIREYIANYCPQLHKNGFTKIGFIIVSNSFKDDLKDFANEITWNTEIKRFILLSSEALLYYIAYKTKDDKITLPVIIESMVNSGNVITARNVIEKFDDI